MTEEEPGGGRWRGIAKIGAVAAGLFAAAERRRRAAISAEAHVLATEQAVELAAERAALRSAERTARQLAAAHGAPADPDAPVPPEGAAVRTDDTVPAPRPAQPVDPPVAELPAGAAPLGRPANPVDAVPWSLRVAAESTWRLLLLGVALYVVLRVVDTLKLVAFAAVAALLISALLEPTVSWLRRYGVPRSVAAATAFLTGLASIGLVGWFVFWQVSSNLDPVTVQVQNGVRQLRDWLLTGPFHLTPDQLNNVTNQITTAIGKNSEELTSAGFTGVTIAVELLTGVVLTAFTTFFLLYDGARIWSWVLRALPRHSRYAMTGAGPKAWATLTAYVRGTVTVAFIDALCIGTGLFMLGVPMAIPLAVIIFLGAFVPLVGALVTGTIAVLIAVVTVGPAKALIALAILIGVQQLEGHILQPLILGRAVRVHPLAVVLGVAAGSILGGIPGAIVAVPLIAVTNTVTGHLRQRNAAGQEVFQAIEAARKQ
ncbi:putative PurR-regulated permease PerM [Kitasatospora sp. SolWspMP-SS2h]|uniref:AI-2E family transporter n=1 Tax=Kitasatospora sp. SolWspMP-SS2h TaxID=1305729 RepID=UPI000DB91A6C|nr:AI-2E family transporter [Kitasatospora sp. SolWspMP-SS2h]RAJ30356.1 putative PurR-regulated permease PerM [Kitasatospora sp. SolWspMP-SS2h]